jgi:hypothetical protein
VPLLLEAWAQIVTSTPGLAQAKPNSPWMNGGRLDKY